MSIKLTCTLCLKELDIPDSFAGRKGKCPYCGEVLDIPAPGEATAAAATEQTQPTAQASAPTQPPRAEPAPPEVAGQSAAGEPAPTADRPAAARAAGERHTPHEQAQDTVPTPAPAMPPAPTDGPKLRLSVMLPAAIVVIGATAAAMAFYMSLGSTAEKQGGGPPVVMPGVDAAADIEPAPTGGAVEPEPAPVAVERGRYPETRRVAVGLSTRTCLYAEIQRPAEILQRLAELPAWKDQQVAARRCEEALEEFVLLAARRYGRSKAEIRGLLANARTLHLAFESFDKWPLVIVSLDGQASRDNLFGKGSAVKPRRTLTFDGISVDVFIGENERQLFAGYYNYCAVLGPAHDVVNAAIRRLKTEPPDNLMNDEEFVQALSVREGDGSWVCFMPANNPDLQRGPWAGRLQANLLTSLQLTLDSSGRTITGVLSAGGLPARLLGGRLTGEAARYAPADAAVCVSIAATAPVDLAALGPSAGNSTGGVAWAEVMAAVKPEAACVVPAATDAPPLLVAPIADAATLRAQFDKLVRDNKAKQSRHKEFTLISAGGLVVGFDANAMLASTSEASVRSCIDAAKRKEELAEPDNGTLCGFASVRLAALAGRLDPSMADLFADDATATLTAIRSEGMIRLAGDGDFVSLLAAWFSDAAEKRKRENERRRQEELRKAEAASWKNIEEINDCINEYVARNIENAARGGNVLLDYPLSIKEVIDAGKLDAALLQCPLDDEPALQRDGVLSSYDFIFNHVAYRMPAEVAVNAGMLIVWERKPLHKGKHLAAFVVGRPKLLSPDELKKALAESIAQAEKNAPKKVKIPRR